MGVTINNVSTITEPSTLKDQNELRIKYEYVLGAKRRSDVETILQRHYEVFKRIGDILVKMNDEEGLVIFYEIRGCTHCTESKICSILY